MHNKKTLRYALGGLLFGLLFPLLALIIDGFLFKHLAFEWDTIIQLHKNNPIHFVIDSAPFVLSGAFALMGYYADKLIQSYENNEISYQKYSDKNKRLLQKIRLGNILAPFIISTLFISSYLIIHNFLSNQQNDAPVISISGRQRMLSQKIAKNSLHLIITKKEEASDYISHLNDNIKDFKEAHQNLIGKKTTLNLSKNHVNSVQTIQLFDSLTPYYNGIVTGVTEIIKANTTTDDETRKINLQEAAEKIEYNEQLFLPIMQKIVEQYEKEAAEKIEDIEVAQFSVIIILIIFVVFVSIFIIRPVIDKVKRAFLDVETATKTLEENNQELQSSEEELRQNAEQMKVVNNNFANSQKELEIYVNRVSQAKNMAKLAAYDLDLKTNTITHTEHLNILLGLDKNIKINTQFLESVIHTEDYSKLLESQKTTIRTHKDTYYRLRIKTDYFEDWHWFQGTTHCVFDKQDNLSYIVNSLQDITDNVNKEQEIEKLLQEAGSKNQELQASEEELRQNTEQLQLINDNLFVAQRQAKEQRELLNRAEKISKIGSFDLVIDNLTFTYSENLVNIYELDKDEMNDIKTHAKYFDQDSINKIREGIQKLVHGEVEQFSVKAFFKSTNQKEAKILQIEANLIRGISNKPERILGVVQDVTQITLQQEALRASQEQLESLSNNLQGVMYRSLIDTNRTIKFISKGVERITGYPASDFIDNKVRSFSSIIYKEDDFINAEISQAIETKEPFKVEYRITQKNGSVIWIEESGQMVEDTINKINYLDSVLMDITQRKQGEQNIEAQAQKLLISKNQLTQQQQMLNDAEKMAKMGTYVWNLVTREIKHSKNLPAIYGLEKDIVINQIIFDSIMYPEDRKNHQKAMNEAIMAGKKEIYTTYKAKPSHLSEEHWKDYRNYSIIEYNKKGEPITIIGTVQDISKEVAQKKRAEELLEYVRENKENLEESQRLAQIVSYDMNLTTKKIEWSNSFENVFKVENNQIPQDAAVFHNWTEQEDLEEVNKSWKETLAKKEEFNAIYRINTPNKQTFYVREKSYPVFDNKGDIVHMKGTLQDITKTELAKLKLERTSEKLEKQNTNLVSSINYAQRIQSAMLGGTHDLTKIFDDSFVFFEPKDVVSGDFYWYNETGNYKIAIVGDCTGHGVPGAFMSLLGTTLLNEIILQRQIMTPSKILDFMQSEIRTILKQDTTGNRDGMDMAIVIVNTTTGVIEFAGAKNPLIYLHKKRIKGGIDTNLTIIKGDVHPIGGRTEKYLDAKYTNHIINLEDVEAFYIYSDGYQDQFGGEEGRKFMSTKFRKLLYDTHSTSMRHQRVSLKRGLMNWMGTEYEQIDDICVMGISV